MPNAETREEPPGEDPTDPPGRLPAWRRHLQWPALAVAVAAIAWSATTVVRGVNQIRAGSPGHVPVRTEADFDLSSPTIPLGEMRSGGPPKDGIPALNDPEFVPSGRAAYLNDGDEVIGVALGGVAKAYPLRILDYHEVVNDTVGGVPVAVTYCPLCDSSVVFDRRVGDRVAEFGVSGRLYNSNVLMFDRRADVSAESLWSQMGSEGVSGWGSGRRLRRLPLEVTTWASWRERRPDTLVLSADTGHSRRYDRSVYASYFASDRLMFPVNPADDRLPRKERVLGVAVGGAARAYPISALVSGERLSESLAGASFDIVPDASAGTLRVETDDPNVEWCYSFWFAWSAFSPDTEVAGLQAPSL